MNITAAAEVQPQKPTIIPGSIEIVKEKLYWICSQDPPVGVKYFNVDGKIKYLKYYQDFGPACIANITNFSRLLNKFLQNSNNEQLLPVYYHSSKDPEMMSNAGLLISAFQVIVLNRSPEEVWEKISHIQFLSFRDASYNKVCKYECSILDCLKALKRAIDLKWYSLNTFDIPLYERIENQDSGNINQIIPGEISAFRGPLSQEQMNKLKHQGKYFRVTIQQLLPFLKEINTAVVIRLNSSEEYDKSEIEQSGITHFDLYFPDGSCPTPDIIDQFCTIVDEYKGKGSIGVHCKAGLGRTGTLIACYAIKKYNFTSREIIAWTRLCRSGSILGKQQYFLEQYERYLKEQQNLKKQTEAHDEEITIDQNNKSLSIDYKDTNEIIPQINEPNNHQKVNPKLKQDTTLKSNSKKSAQIPSSNNQENNPYQSPPSQNKNQHKKKYFMDIWSCLRIFKKKVSPLKNISDKEQQLAKTHQEVQIQHSKNNASINLLDNFFKEEKNQADFILGNNQLQPLSLAQTKE